MNIDELAAKESEKKKLAEATLKKRVEVGAKQQGAIISRAVETIIVDKLVYPKSMFFSEKNDDIVLFHKNDDSSLSKDHYTIHNHAMGQMASLTGIPRLFVNNLRYNVPTLTWRLELLAHNFNELFWKGSYLDRHRNDARYLHRYVNGQLRGFLSRSYNRKLLTVPLLRAFIESCAEHKAAPVSALSSDIRMSLSCMVPFVFEPVEGEFVAFGSTFSNSDFGAGKTKVSGTVMRINSNTVSVMQDQLSRVHLGSVIEDSDLEVSDSTLDKELEAHKGAIKDSVNSLLSYEAIERNLKTIQAAHDLEIPWHKLKSVIGKLLTKAELDLVENLLKNSDGTGIVDLPPPRVSTSGDNIPSAWWGCNVVGWFANSEKDDERKQDLQQLAGSLLST